MDKKDDIISLIQSLSKSEKRYFKLFVDKNTKGESNHYKKLFDLIERAGTAEKKVIQNLYRDDNFMRSQYRVYKHLTYKMILKSLTAYHSEKSIDDQIQESIRQAKVLFDKNLYTQAAKMLEKVKYIASKHEKYPHLLEIIRWQKKIIVSSLIYGMTTEKDIIQLIEEEESSIHKIENISKYWKQNMLIYMVFRTKGVAREQEDIERYNLKINVPVLKNEELALSYQAKLNFHFAYATYYGSTNKLKEAYTSSKKILDLMESHLNQIEEDPKQYCVALYNLLYYIKYLKKYEEFFTTIPKLKAMSKRFPEIDENIRSVILSNAYNLEFGIYIDIGQFEKAATILAEMEALLQNKTNSDAMFELVFNVNRALLYFGNKDYQKAIFCNNLILNKKKEDLREDQYSYAKIFQLILHFEKGNSELLPYLVKSCYRYLLQKNKLHKIENTFLLFIRTKAFHISTKKDQIEAFKALREELIIASEDSIGARFLEFFDIISWLESKIKNRSFESILREKSGYGLEE